MEAMLQDVDAHKKTTKPDFNSIGFFLVLEFKNKPWKYIKSQRMFEPSFMWARRIYHDS